MKIPAKGFTHGGKFHADDVFATALLMIVRPDIKVTRGFVVPDGFDGIVYDVGCGMFDHHQEPRESRPNGVPYAAFGLLWRVLGAQLVGAHQARLLDENNRRLRTLLAGGPPDGEQTLLFSLPVNRASALVLHGEEGARKGR